VENLQRSEIHPLDEARGFRALLQLDGAGYDIHKISAKIGKTPNYVATRLKLTELVREVAEAFLKDGLAIGHALLIAKLPEGMQKEALSQAYASAWGDGKHERVLRPIASLQAWIEQHVFLQLDKVPFRKTTPRSCRKQGVAWIAQSGRVSISYFSQTLSATRALIRAVSI